MTGEAAKSKSVTSLAVGSLVDAIWALDRACRLFGDLDLQQRTNDLLHRMTTLEPVGEDVGVGGAHARELHRRRHLRHSFASRALALGQGLPVITRLLSHRRVETTARYVPLPRDSVSKSTERIVVSIAGDIL